MADTKDQSEDAITKEELVGTTISTTTPPRPKNAFSELMSHKRKAPSSPPTASTSPQQKRHPRPPPTSQPQTDASSNLVHGRHALLPYIQSPTTFPASRVISHDTNFVVIRDAYPKASVHLLLLPRDPARYLLHPFDALSDPAFLALIRKKAGEIKRLAASELRRLYGRDSVLDAARNAALDASDSNANEELPPGRNWEADILVGIHAHPSMSHLHIHILSVDRVSASMKHRKHYNTFATPFFVPLDDFPLAEDDARRHESYLDRELVCWRCGKGWGRKFAEFKGHLEVEREEWKKL